MSPVKLPAGLRLRVDDLETWALPHVCALTTDPGESLAPAGSEAGPADACAQEHPGRVRGLRR